MTKPDIVLIGSYPDWDMAPLREAYTLHDRDTAAPEAVRAIAFKFHESFAGADMDRYPDLGLIANYGVGYDAIDVEAASQRGIKVTNTPDVLTDDVADLAVGMVLAARRHIPQADAYVRAGRWAAEGPYPLLSKVSGKRAGIIGLGRIGRAIAERLAAFGMEIAYFSRAPKEAPGWRHCPTPMAVAEISDIVVVALSGGPDTEGLVDAATIEALGPEGLLVNIARGSCVDEAALLDALEARRLGQAALDVFLGEPRIDPRFLTLDNVLLQPHQASATVETRRAMGQLQRDNLAAFFAGKPLPTAVN